MSDKVIPLSPPSVHLPPPEGMTEDQAQVWRETVEARSADFFGQEQSPLLEEYCRVVVMCRLLAMQIEASIAEGAAADLKLLLDMRDKESRRLTSLATKLRITNQSRYTPQAAATAAKRGSGTKVWQFGKAGA